MSPEFHTDALARSLSAYAAGETEPEFVIPSDLTALSDEELAALHEQAVANFDALYGDGVGLSEEDLATLAGLTEGIEAILAVTADRQEAAESRAAQAAELASRVRPGGDLSADTADGGGGDGGDGGDGDGEGDGEDDGVQQDGDIAGPGDGDGEDDEENTDSAGDDGAAQTQTANTAVAASGRREIRVSLSGVRSRQRPSAPAQARPRTMRDLVSAATDLSSGGFVPGAPMDWNSVARAVDRRLSTFNKGVYENARRANRAMREQYGVAVFRRPIPPELMITGNDSAHIEEVLARAMDETRLPGGSLVASGGWCAPSETLYTMCELETRDGLYSIPEVGVARGGINRTLGPNFADIYNATGFCYTEQDAIDGDWDGSGGGSKPCFHVDCPDWEDHRMDVCGLCITAGLLTSVGYPEIIARTTRGALVAHDHKMSARAITAVAAGSTAITMTPAQVGAAAPLLTAIELQVQHYRATNRLLMTQTLEAVFPFWVHSLVRSDLALRLGVDFFAVTDAQIDSWFALRGISPQFVYDWQDISTTAATAFTKWPATVQFLLYLAGTWVRGITDVITLDTIYDSTNLPNNEFTALFTEEGNMVVKMCHDSRAITIALCPDGSTNAGLDIACDGTAAPVGP
jgi:hypothetical protein